MSGCHQLPRTPVLGLLLFLLLSMVLGRPEAGWSSSLPRGQQITSSQTQQAGNGGLLPFPEGRGPDGTLYKTDYRCEGENMTVSCIDSDGPGLHGTIQVVRGNFGRFSIAICNRHGQTDWSVNCMAPYTTKVLQKKCEGQKECVVPVNSELFHDACPGTHKYLEIHYACLSANSDNKKGPRGPPKLPGWFKPKNSQNIPNMATPASSHHEQNSVNSAVNSNKTETESVGPRKPILVTKKGRDKVPITTESPRVPITTESTTTPSTKSRTDSTTTTPRTTSSPTPAPIHFPDVKPNKTHVNTGVSTPPSNSVSGPHVTPMTGALACQPVTARQLQWNWTPAGQVALQPCPIGANGLARWYCADTPAGPVWQGTSPDMSDCKSLAITTLEGQVRQEDPENVLVSSLAYLTRTKALYGGDLEAVVTIMRTVASRIQYRLQSSSNFHDKVNHIRQVLLNVLRSAANILEDGPNRHAWLDLSADRQMKVATSLMLALEENAFLLAGVTEQPEEILETYETLTMTIKVASVSGLSGLEKVEFPAKPLLYVDDKISLAASDLEDNSQGGLGEAVFFSYRGLHEILSGAKTHLSFEEKESKPISSQPQTQDHLTNFPSNQWRLASRIISASLGRGRHIELQSPVTITLRHLEADPKISQASEPVCVFWDYEVHGWSDSGCRLVETNQTYSICQCDHLTNFAILVKPQESVTTLRLDIIVCSVAAAILLFVLVAIYKMRTRLKSWCQSNASGRGRCRGCLASVCLCRCCCGPENGDKTFRGQQTQNSHLEKCQSFYQGLSQNGPLQGPGGLSGSLSGGPYHPAAFTAKKSRTLGVGQNGQLTSGLIGSAHTTSRAVNGSQYVDPSLAGGQLRTLNSTPLMMLNTGKGPRPHITLNPYSTQLVDNLNMMMPGNGNNNNSSTTSGGSNSSASTNSTSLGTPISGPCQNNPMMTPQLMHLTNTLRRGTPQDLTTQTAPSCGQNQQLSGDNVIYRSVSPHGHIYWDIDTNQVYGTNNNQFYNEESVALLSQQNNQVQQGQIVHQQQVLPSSGHHMQHTPNPYPMDQQQQTFSRPYLTSRHGQLTEEDLLLQQNLLAGDPSQITNGLHDSLHGLQHTNEPQFQPGMVMMASSSNSRQNNSGTENRQNNSNNFVRQGANRFTRKSNSQQAQPQQPQVNTVSAADHLQAAVSNQSSAQAQSQSVPEQLQTQVQIRDILPIQVSVKSSEYIEAKIRTLRRDLNKPTNLS